MEYEVAEELLSAEIITSRVAEIGQEISRKYRGKPLTVIAILRGAVVFLSDLIRQIDPSVKLSLDFMRVSSYGNSTVNSGEIKILQDLDNTINGAHVLIVEDIIDTGLSLNRLKEYLLQKNPASLEICALLDKKERRIVQVDLDYVGFEIPDRFVVGYGLDYAERWRNLPAIHVMRPVES